jgi:signal peptidase I
VSEQLRADRPRPQAPGPRARGQRAMWEAIETILVALILAFLIRTFVLESFVVHGYSMEPNLRNGEHVLVDKLIFDLVPPHDNEIIVLKPPILGVNEFFIKRVIGTPGQTVLMKNGYVYVNGRLQPEPYLRYRGTANYGPVKVPPHDVFVLGDNRPESEDSRIFGMVPDANIQGQAFFAFWPLSRFGLLPS